MYSYLFGKYFYQDEIINMIEEVEQTRKLKRLKCEKINTSFAEDLKNAMMGIKETIKTEEETIKDTRRQLIKAEILEKFNNTK